MIDRVRFLIHWWNDNPEDVNAFHIEVMESAILGPEEEPEPDGRDCPIQLMLDCIQLGDYLNFVEHIHAQGAVNEGLVDVNATIDLRFYRDHLEDDCDIEFSDVTMEALTEEQAKALSENWHIERPEEDHGKGTTEPVRPADHPV